MGVCRRIRDVRQRDRYHRKADGAPKICSQVTSSQGHVLQRAPRPRKEQERDGTSCREPILSCPDGRISPDHVPLLFSNDSKNETYCFIIATTGHFWQEKKLN